MDERGLTADEAAALKTLMRTDAGQLPDAGVRDGLLARGFVRREPGGFSITLAGHARYISGLRQAFD